MVEPSLATLEPEADEADDDAAVLAAVVVAVVAAVAVVALAAVVAALAAAVVDALFFELPQAVAPATNSTPHKAADHRKPNFRRTERSPPPTTPALPWILIRTPPSTAPGTKSSMGALSDDA